MGTPVFAIPVLNSLLHASDGIKAVYTAPDRPRGRGQVKGYSPIKEYALKRGLRLLQPASLRNSEVQREFLDLAPDLVVVAAYGRLVPLDLLKVPEYGFVNVHPSLLPKFRGPSPVVTAILDGVEKTGVTLILLDEGLDSGPILAQEETSIGPNELVDALTMRLFRIGGELLVKTLPRWTGGHLTTEPQDATLATFTRKIVKEDGEVDWTEAATDLYRRFRAFTPWPGLYTRWRGRMIKLLDLVPLPGEAKGEPGTVEGLADQEDTGVGVVTGGGLVAVGRLQLEGRRALTAEEFVRGYPDFAGSHLPS